VTVLGVSAPTCMANRFSTVKITVQNRCIFVLLFGWYSLQLDNKYGLLTEREVKMAGYRPSSYFGCLWTETE